MSVNASNSPLFNSAVTNRAAGPVASPRASERGAEASAGSFSASLTLRLAEFQSQTVSSLMSSVFNSGSGGDATGGLFGAANGTAGDAGGQLGGLAANGRNLSLFDPESGYKMMTLINQKDVDYKAQFAELSEMKSELFEMRDEGLEVTQIGLDTDNATIKQELAEFVAEFNEWTQRFDADMQAGGILAGTQAAQVARYELRTSIENRFFGAADGLNGLRDLGITIDPVSKLASLDGAQLDRVLATNKQGVVNTLQDFGSNFAKSAGLLNSEGNFIPNRLGNLDRVIDYISANKASLQAEFGLGDAAKPTGKLAEALAAYERMAQA